MKLERRDRKMGIPQIIVVAWYALSLGVNLANHGKKREDKYSFWSSLIVCVLLFALLKWGGFFE